MGFSFKKTRMPGVGSGYQMMEDFRQSIRLAVETHCAGTWRMDNIAIVISRERAINKKPSCR